MRTALMLLLLLAGCRTSHVTAPVVLKQHGPHLPAIIRDQVSEPANSEALASNSIPTLYNLRARLGAGTLTVTANVGLNGPAVPVDSWTWQMWVDLDPEPLGDGTPELQVFDDGRVIDYRDGSVQLGTAEIHQTPRLFSVTMPGETERARVSIAQFDDGAMFAINYVFAERGPVTPVVGDLFPVHKPGRRP